MELICDYYYYCWFIKGTIEDISLDLSKPRGRKKMIIYNHQSQVFNSSIKLSDWMRLKQSSNTLKKLLFFIYS